MNLENPEIWPPLPLSANYYLRAEKLEEYTCALSDFNCWMDGFKAAGGIYSPQTQESLRDLNSALKSIQATTPVNDPTHTPKRKNK